jgi:anthraniloyl-CoA monooxygenase
VNVVCIGGGPAGLYLGILLKLRDPRHVVTVYERNRPADTFGFGVVFSFATLGNLEAADPVSYGQLAQRFARWEDIEIHVAGEVLRSTGHGFCGLERKELLAVLQARARELGVQVWFEREVRSLGEVTGGADVIVAADGVASGLRDAHAAALGPSVDVRPNKFVWLGTTVPYRAFTFLFKESVHGLFRVHAYPFSADRSTFIVECREETWRRAGLDAGDEEHTVRVLEELFAAELGGHRLIRNRSIWRNFPTVRCRSWHDGNLVIVGDAAHTAHFSIGSGTKLAMEDSIELAAALADVEDGDGPGDAAARPAKIAAALAAYQARRKPEVESLQAAAQASLEWFEGTEWVMKFPPAQFAYHLMTRSLRVSHRSMQKRDPELAAAVERLVAGGGEGVSPRQTATRFCGQALPHREVEDASFGMRPALLYVRGALVRMEGTATLSSDVMAPRVMTHGAFAAVAASLDEVAALRAQAPAGGGEPAIGLEVIDQPGRRDALIAEVAVALAAGRGPAFALARPAPGAEGERLAAAPLEIGRASCRERVS